MIKSGLGRRIALLFMRLLGKRTIGLALQLRFLRDSESMGNHDSKIVDAGRVD